MLSVVLLLGYTGQLSLAQFALAGLASLIAHASSPSGAGRSSSPSSLAVVVHDPDRPALRDPRAADARHQPRGRDARARDERQRDDLHEHDAGSASTGFTVVGGQTFFGIDIDPITHGRRGTGSSSSSLLVLCALSVASIRRGVVGRRLIAVRTNERAAAALGISVFGVKLYAFGVRRGDRGDRRRPPRVSQHDGRVLATSCRSQSILAVAYTVIGGIGFVLGAPFGSQLVQGGFGTWLLDSPWGARPRRPVRVPRSLALRGA